MKLKLLYWCITAIWLTNVAECKRNPAVNKSHKNVVKTWNDTFKVQGGIAESTLSWDSIKDLPPLLEGFGGTPLAFPPAPVLFPAEANFRLEKGPNRHQLDNTKRAQKRIDGSEFDLIRRYQPAKVAPEYLNFYYDVMAKVSAADLETNITEYGTDCELYGWSESAKWDQPPRERQFVRFPIRNVRTQFCNGGDCRIETGDNDNYLICHTEADLGTPVLCGPEKKVTYLVSKPSGGWLPGCSPRFSAYHVPHLARAIHVPDNGLQAKTDEFALE